MVQQSLKRLLAWARRPGPALALLITGALYALVWDYVTTYNRHVPIRDQWSGSLQVALEWKYGALSAQDLFTIGGHRTLFNNLVTIVFTSLTDWNVALENALNPVLALLNLCLLAALFVKTAPHLVPWALVPLGLLVFSLSQELNWTIGLFGVWHYAVFFPLLTLTVLLYAPRGALAFGAALLLSLVMTVSFNGGVGIWLLTLAGLWVAGYRRRGYYIAGLLAAAGAAGVYLRILATMEGDFNEPGLPAPDEGLQFLLMLFGNAFSISSPTTATLMGGAGWALWLLNGAFLWRHSPERVRRLGPWVILAGYALSVAGMITLGRLHAAGLHRALETRYITTGNLFWAAFVAFALLTLHHLLTQAAARRAWHQALLTMNLIFLALMGGLYLRNQIVLLQLVAHNTTGHYIFESRPPEGWYQERCVVNYPLNRDAACLDQQLQGTPERIYQMAAARLAIFREVELDNLLPPQAREESRVIIHTDAPGLNIYAREYLLAGIDPAAVFHIAPAPQADEFYPNPPRTWHTADDLSALTDFLQDSPQLWYIAGEHDATIAEALEAVGYVGTPYFIQVRPRYRDAQFSITRFQRPPDDLQTRYQFGEERIQLLAADAPEVVQPCQALTVTTWWRSPAPPQDNYSLSVALFDDAGQVVAQQDGAISHIPMLLWEVERLYVDTRRLTAPCDLPRGDYDLRLGFYRLAEGAFAGNLPAFSADDDPLGERPLLSRLRVE